VKRFICLTLLFLSAFSLQAQIVWEPTNVSGICPSITVSGTGIIYAGDINGKFYKSQDNGVNWTTSSIGNPYSVSDIAVAPNGNIFISTGESGNGVYKSTDGGLSWQICAMTAGVVTRKIKIKSGVIFVSSRDNGLGKSSDDGITWAGASSSVPESNIGAFNISNQGSLLLGVKGSNGLYRSTDDGSSWTLTNFPQSKRIYSLTVASNNHIFAGTAEQYDGVYRSIDDGLTWNKVIGLPTDKEYSSNGFSTSDGKLFLGILNTGIYVSTDNGAGWNLENTGLQSLIGFSFAQSSDGKIFATTGSGIFRNSGTSDVDDETTNPDAFILKQNFPNPFNPTTKISYTVQTEGFVSLKIFNVLGQQVATPISKHQTAGKYEIDFNASDLPSGAYLYSLTVGNLTSNKKMILSK
jgi:photosystem II stability/assembly factor-like uncharacterized protein